MNSGAVGQGYRELLVFLVTAGVIAPLFNRLRVSPVLGFLIAGAALGPEGLGRLVEAFPAMGWVTLGRPEDLAPLAQLGVVFLLFMIGLELSWARLLTLRRLMLRLGFAQVAISTSALSLVALALGQPPMAAAVIGAALSLSSTALVIPALAERQRLTSPAGRACLAVLLAQDLAVAPILISIGLMAGLHGGARWSNAVVNLVLAGAALTALVVAGRLLLRPLFRSAALAKSPDMFAAASLLIVVGSAAAAEAVGLSTALGAFVAGLLLAETEFRREVEVAVNPFRGLLLGMFFVSVGAGLKLDRLAAEPSPILAVTAGVVSIKGLTVLGLGRLSGLPPRAAAEAALSLGPSGEFAFVVAAQASAAGLLGKSASDVAVISAGLGFFLIPPLAWVGSRIAGPRHEAVELTPDPIPEGEPANHSRVLVMGYGRVGKLVGEMLRVHQIEFTGVDDDPRVVAAGRDSGVRLYFGDASRESFLAVCGLANASAVVVTMDAPGKVDEVVRAVRSLRPDVTLIARARDARHALSLYRLGVTDAVPEAIEASLQLAENTLVDLGVPMGLVIASIHEKRDEIRRLLSDGVPRQVRSFRRSSSPRRPD
jgi:CPA2 family monovalent cation:H+ antiporter-2